MTYQQTKSIVKSDGLVILCKQYQIAEIAEGAVMRGKDKEKLIALGQQVMTPYGQGKVVWFTTKPEMRAVVSLNGIPLDFAFDELQPASETSAQTEGVAQ